MKTAYRFALVGLLTLFVGEMTASAAPKRGASGLTKAVGSRSATPNVLSSGVPFNLSIGPVTQSTLFTGDYSSVITVPAGATRLEIQVTTQPGTADVDLYARFGADVELSGTAVVAEHRSDGDTGNELVVITSTTSPALRAGTYYIALGLFTLNVTATVTIKATVTPGVPALGVPVLTTGSVVNAADGTGALAPGTIVSIYGLNLATGTLKGPLPLLRTLLGSSVEVLSNGRTLSAPLFFVSTGQINAQLPYEAAAGVAQLRVRNAAGASEWMNLSVQASAPRILTANMRGSGAAILQHADYRLVSEEAPAVAGEVLVMYLIGLGQTQPAAQTGLQAGDGAAMGPLNVSPPATVSIGGINAVTLWAGLTPGLVGLYQINLRVPAGLSGGDLSVLVSSTGTLSQSSVTARVSGSRTALVIDHQDLNLPQDSAVTFQVGLSGEAAAAGAFRVRTSPVLANVGVSASASRIDAKNPVTVTVISSGPMGTEAFEVIVEADLPGGAVSAALPVYGWRLATQALLPKLGGSISAGGLRLTLPANALLQDTMIRIYTGKPKTGMEDYMTSAVLLVEGIPANYKGTLGVELTQTPGLSASSAVTSAMTTGGRFADPPPPPMLLITQPEAGLGKSGTFQVGYQMFPATASGTGVVSATIEPAKLKFTNRLTFSAFQGYYAIETPRTLFRIYYPINYREAAISIGTWLASAYAYIEGDGLGLGIFIQLLNHNMNLPITVTLRPLDPTIGGLCDGSSLALNTLKLSTPADIAAFQSTPAHELMHLVQALYGGSTSGVYSAWWSGTFPWFWADEALSAWIEPFAMNNPASVPSVVGGGLGTSNNYLIFPLQGLAVPPGTKLDQEYGYGASMFLTYLYKMNPAAMTTWLRNRNPGQNPTQALAVAVGGMNKLSEYWRFFMGRYLAGDLYGGKVFPEPKSLLGEEKFNIFEDYDLHTFTFNKAREMSAMLYTVRFTMVKEVPELTDGVTLGLKVMDSLPDVEATVISLAENKVIAGVMGSASGPQEIEIPNGMKYVTARDTWVVAVNNFRATAALDTTQDIKVRVGLADPKLRITPDWSSSGGIIGGTYTFSTANTNIPKDALYSWNFGGDGGATGRTVTHSFRNAGTYAVKVSVTVRGELISDTTNVRIAPDTPVTKADVLFQVTRKLSSAVGSSNQACQNYSIIIKGADGREVESGESFLRNGAYDTILPVAAGYTYSIRYTFTTPCASSGTLTGRFEVKANQVNYVSAQGPDCSF
jgi:uncharacterized protein (TIGR03437 family)